MSTGLNCEIIQASATEWFYVLEDGGAPKDAWDWREHACAYGPFPTMEAAIDHLDENHANPGGWWERPLRGDGTDAPLGETYERLFAEARKARTHHSHSRSASLWRPRAW